MTKTVKFKPKSLKHSPTVGRLRAEEMLFLRMEEIAKHISDEGDFGRSAATEAVDLLLGYLKERGLSGQGMMPLGLVNWGLQDLNKGVLPEIFDLKAINPDGTPRRRRHFSTASKNFQMHAAACMDALMKRDRYKKSRAAAEVASHARTWPRYAALRIEKATVIAWRDNYLQMASKSHDRLSFDMLVEILTSGPNAARILRETLNHGPFFLGGLPPSEKT